MRCLFSGKKHDRTMSRTGECHISEGIRDFAISHPESNPSNLVP